MNGCRITAMPLDRFITFFFAKAEFSLHFVELPRRCLVHPLPLSQSVPALTTVLAARASKKFPDLPNGAEIMGFLCSRGSAGNFAGEDHAKRRFVMTQVLASVSV